jgi:hypothetical protein
MFTLIKYEIDVSDEVKVNQPPCRTGVAQMVPAS